jgi:N-acetyl-gamma-glutamyl-phosphate reductase
MNQINVVVIGARGYTGSELLPILEQHPQCVISAVGSGSAAGQPLSEHIPGLENSKLVFSDIRSDNLEEYPGDLYILALPNGQAPDYVAAIDEHFPESVVIDLSADYRFDESWDYGQPERFPGKLKGAKRIANPGCYATGAQLSLHPLNKHLVSTPVIFGVSGHSGAGKTPSRKNDPDVLRDNLIPYSLADHVHEREVSYQLGKPVRFLPHVASFFRGINLSIAVELDAAQTPEGLLDLFQRAYAECPLITVQAEMPEVAQVRGQNGVIIGGFTVSKADPKSVSLVCVLDNLLKGAASQAVQNMNLAFGLPDLMGLESNPAENGKPGHG